MTFGFLLFTENRSDSTDPNFQWSEEPQVKFKANFKAKFEVTVQIVQSVNSLIIILSILLFC